VGAAAKLGEELVEGRRIVREARESASSLRRAIDPAGTTRQGDKTVETKKGPPQKKDV
jgi:hypothetical protein